MVSDIYIYICMILYIKESTKVYISTYLFYIEAIGLAGHHSCGLHAKGSSTRIRNSA